MNAAEAAPWPLDRIQGLLIRGYRADYARHIAFSLAPGDAARESARAFLLGLTEPKPGEIGITTAAPWGAERPPIRLNIAFTFRGLVNLGVPAASLAIFNGPPGQVDSNYLPFAQGTKKRAARYLNEPNPGGWELSDGDFDLLLSMWADSIDARDRYTETLRALTPATFADFSDDDVFDGHAFDGNRVYFGYEDNIAQPLIDGSPFNRTRFPDGGQDRTDPSAFLIGTGSNVFSAKAFTPARFGAYGCFGGFLKLRQDIEKFEAQVAALAPQMATIGVTDPNVQPEALMAAMCGRWRNGVSLTAHPIAGNSLPPTFDPRTANDYRYDLPDGTPDVGTVCPIGSHMRRGNMRLRAADPPLKPVPFPATPSSLHRIMRRAMPYQIPYLCDDRHNPETERGLVGLFLGASLLQQFEQVFGAWTNSLFFTDYTELTDPLMGAGNPGKVTLPGVKQAIGGKVSGCVQTRAAAYVFYPGIDGIRFIAGA